MQKLLTTLQDTPGLLGYLITATDGNVIGSSMPKLSDLETIASLSSTLLSNEDVARQIREGNKLAITLRTEPGFLHIIEANKYLFAVLTAEEPRMGVERIIRSFEEQK
ncbi:MAG TPA: roadblock/LC7 domain-containing protein [Planktothrix sp.]